MQAKLAKVVAIVGVMLLLGQTNALSCENDRDCDSGMKCGDDGECHTGKKSAHKVKMDDDDDQVAHWCCTPMGKFGPYPPNDVHVGQPCHWPTPMGMAVGQACN